MDGERILCMHPHIQVTITQFLYEKLIEIYYDTTTTNNNNKNCNNNDNSTNDNAKTSITLIIKDY